MRAENPGPKILLFGMRSGRLDPAAIVQGSGLPVNDARHMVLGPGRFQLAGFLESHGFMTLRIVSVYSFKLPISEAEICFALLFSRRVSLRAK